MDERPTLFLCTLFLTLSPSPPHTFSLEKTTAKKGGQLPGILLSCGTRKIDQILAVSVPYYLFDHNQKEKENGDSSQNDGEGGVT